MKLPNRGHLSFLIIADLLACCFNPIALQAIAQNYLSPLELTQDQEPQETNFTTPLHRQNKEITEPFQPEKLPFVPRSLEQQKKKLQSTVSPSISIITPSAYGLSWGKVGIGVGYQERTRFTQEDDGVIGIGLGFGDPQANVGLQMVVTLTDVSDPFADGNFNLKLHRQVAQDFNVALGVNGLVNWGETDGGSSVYGVITKRFPLKKDQEEPFSEIYTSLGIGGGQFRSESTIIDDRDGIGVFGSVALRVVPSISAIAEWTGQDLTLGVSIVPFQDIPLVIVPAVTDITNNAGDGARFILGAGYRFSFK